MLNNFATTEISTEQIQLEAFSDSIRVIEAIDGQLITNELKMPCRVVDGDAVPDIENDVLKIVLYNRYHSIPPGIAFVKGFGITSGALASSVAHDWHSIVAVGTNDEDIATAINAVVKEQGGLSVSNRDDVSVLPLPFGELISAKSCEAAGDAYGKLDQRSKDELGSPLLSPYMTLSFMALLVAPSLKLSDKGLFDVDKSDFVTLFV